MKGVCAQCFKVFSSHHKEQDCCSCVCSRRFSCKKVIATCFCCGKTWMDYPHNNKRVLRRFCSYKCYGIARTSGLIHPDVGKAWRGKKMPESMRRKLSNAQKRLVSAGTHPLWKGGITPQNAKERETVEYVLWRERVFKRDDFTCQFCGDRGHELEAHHQKPFSLFPDQRLNEGNGVTLCVECHDTIPNRIPRLGNG